mgnify:CR=1 FL=1
MHRAQRETMKAHSIPDDAGQTPEALRRQALAWVRQLTLGPVTPEQLHAFEAWRDTSPAHQAAVQEAKRLWDALKPTTAVLANGSPGMVQAFERSQARRVATRRAFLGAAGMTAAVAGIAVAYPPLGLWRSPAEWGADYHTAIGEQQELALAPGVAVALNTRTSARREVVDDRLVGLDLLAGETAVDLQAGHRFTVRAGVGQSLGDAARFEVRNLVRDPLDLTAALLARCGGKNRKGQRAARWGGDIARKVRRKVQRPAFGKNAQRRWASRAVFLCKLLLRWLKLCICCHLLILIRQFSVWWAGLISSLQTPFFRSCNSQRIIDYRRASHFANTLRSVAWFRTA